MVLPPTAPFRELVGASGPVIVVMLTFSADLEPGSGWFRELVEI